MRFLLVFLFAWAFSPVLNAAACENGVSAGASCSHIEFLGHLSPAELGGSGEVLNDIWGWVDPLNGDEYAIIGMQDGTAFVRLGADGSPIYLGRLRASDGESQVPKSSGGVGKGCHDELCGGEENSAWRDVKVFDHYAYIVSEAIGHGLQIFDLHQLRGLDGTTPDGDLQRASFYEGIGHAHNIFINEESGRAYVVGHDNGSIAGGLHVLDLSNPTNPVMLADLSGDGYTHDVQCVNYSGPDPDVAAGSELCFASNEDTLTVWDVTNPAQAEVLSRTGYSGSAYTHQGWLSPDQQYFFLNDEMDEQHTGTRTHLRVFDVRNVEAPQLAAHYYAPTLAIDHNNYAYGRWLYQSNYTAGLRILDVSDPTAPVEAAYFDPQPADSAVFAGTWSNFVFPSGRIAFTDIRDGVYVVQPTLSESGTVPDLTMTLQLAASSAESGDTVDGTATLENAMAADASDVLVTLHLPVGAVFTATSEPQGWDCTTDADARVTLCRTAAFVAGASATFDIAVSSPGGDIEVIAMAYANEADAAPADNLAIATIDFAGPIVPVRTGGGGGALSWMLVSLLLLAGLRARGVRR